MGADLAALLVMALAACCQGFLGFGYGIVSMSLLTLSHDLVHAAGVVNLTGFLVTGTVLWALRRRTLWRQFGRLLPGLLVGVLLGVFALAHLDRQWMVRALGATVVAIAAWNLLSPVLHESHSRGVDLAVGLVAGGLGGAFNTGGPPLIAHLYSLDEPPDAVKATVQAAFFTISLSRLPIAASQGLMAREVFVDAAWAAPFVLAGLGVGIVLGRRVGGEHFRRVVWIALGALGVVLLVSA